MAKTLHTAAPSSSVARLLDSVAATRAIERVSTSGTSDSPQLCPRTDSILCPGVHGPERRLIKREIVLTPQADATLDRLLELYRRTTCTRLSTSHIIRAMLLAAQPAIEVIADELARVGSLRLPSNAPGWEAERQQFESLLAKALASAICRVTADSKPSSAS